MLYKSESYKSNLPNSFTNKGCEVKEIKHLHILRHGKASWEYPELEDIDRPLLPKGVNNVMQVAELFHEKYNPPDLIISSSAARAIHTALIMARLLNVSPHKVRIDERLYETDSSTVLEVVESVEAKISNLLIVGHNPIFTRFVNLFLPEYLENLPTSGLVTLTFKIKDWSIINSIPIKSDITLPPSKRLI